MANLLVALTINATDELLKEGGAMQSKKKVSDIIALLELKKITLFRGAYKRLKNYPMFSWLLTLFLKRQTRTHFDEQARSGEARPRGETHHAPARGQVRRISKGFMSYHTYEGQVV